MTGTQVSLLLFLIVVTESWNSMQHHEVAAGTPRHVSVFTTFVEGGKSSVVKGMMYCRLVFAL